MKRYFLIFCRVQHDGKYHNSAIVNVETIGGKYVNQIEIIQNLGDIGKFFNYQITNIVELSKSDYEDWIGQEHELIEKDVD